MNNRFEVLLNTLIHNYMPFTLLSDERKLEAPDLIRIFELRGGEICQLTGGLGHDYLYCMSGRVEVIQPGVVKTITPADTKKRPLQLPKVPENTTVIAREDSVIFHADREMLNDLISWDAMVNLSEDNKELHEHLEIIRNTLVFRRLSMDRVEEAFKRMQPMQGKAGQEIMRQGEEGTAFYMLTEGSAEVYRTGLYDNDPRKVRDGKPGDTFGASSLIEGERYYSTVKLLEDSKLMVLKQKDFQELIGSELVKSVTHKIAKTMLEEGYGLIDVRYSEEYDEVRIPGSTLIPLYELHDRIAELDTSKEYVVYCHSGNRSAIAALFLKERNIDAYSLTGGMRDWPYETEQSQ
jgi:rhodanese-related sulfurtransferase